MSKPDAGFPNSRAPGTPAEWDCNGNGVTARSRVLGLAWPERGSYDGHDGFEGEGAGVDVGPAGDVVGEEDPD